MWAWVDRSVVTIGHRRLSTPVSDAEVAETTGKSDAKWGAATVVVHLSKAPFTNLKKRRCQVGASRLAQVFDHITTPFFGVTAHGTIRAVDARDVPILIRH